LAGIRYVWLGRELGGFRRASHDSKHSALENDSFRGYADYMSTEPFRQGIAQLLELASGARTAVMCAEQLWWRCHRSMIADHLTGVHGLTVRHISTETRVDEHRLRPFVRVSGDELIYDIPLPAR
jgi:uncharacterized protein (DUF488 family)